MDIRSRGVSMGLVVAVILGVSLNAQGQESRKLGPDTAKSIWQAKLDPAFQTTKLDRVAVLPFANTPAYREAASIISKNLVSQLSQLHSEYKFLSPEEIMNFINTASLNDSFNIFLGDYVDSGVARADFLAALHDKLQVDAVLVGKVTNWEEHTALASAVIMTVKVKVQLVGAEMALYRTTDGRKIWYGKDVINAGKKERMPEAAALLSEIFARFFGRTPY